MPAFPIWGFYGGFMYALFGFSGRAHEPVLSAVLSAVPVALLLSVVVSTVSVLLFPPANTTIKSFLRRIF